MSKAAHVGSRPAILVLNTDLPIFPGAAGHEFLTMTHLARQASRVGLVSMAHTRQDLERSRGLEDAGVDLYLWQSPWLDGEPAVPARRRAIRIVNRWLQATIAALRTRSNRPSDIHLMDAAFGNLAPGVIRALSDRPWQVLVAVQSSAAAMLDYVPRPLVTVLVMHDIRARLYGRRAEVARSPFERWRFAAEARRYHRFEQAYCGRVDLVVTVSAEDARWVAEHYRPSRVFAAPIPVDADYFAPAAGAVHEHRVVFTGHLSHPPNVDAAVYFATDVLPRIRQRIPSVEFLIVGRSPVDRVRALARLPAVRLEADVPDIRTHIATASVVVAPLRYGSGSRNKILEAWGMEKCVVATTIGVEGLDYESGVNVVVADGSAELAQTISGLLGEPERRARIGRAGRVVACRDHNPAKLAQGYFTELERVCAERARRDVPMRVLIDMRWMVPGQAGGIENLARSFLQELAAIDGHNAYVVLLPAVSRHDFDLRGRSNFHVVSLDSAAALARREWRRLTGAVARRLHWHQWRTPEVADLQWLKGLDAAIAYSFTGYIHPQLYPLRNVLVVPDIQHEYLPQFFSASALEERRRLYTGSIQQAHHICAISEFTRQTLIDRLHVPPCSVTTVPLAADPAFTTRANDAEADARVLARYGLQAGRYLYFPAHTWHHKNHRAAIDALRVLRERYGLTHPLVCSGGPREAQPFIDTQIAAAGLAGQVRFLGYVPRQNVPALYRGAASLLFPSVFEGFGMPVLEAMASGCPVVCSRTTSLPEIAGDAALLVDPNDPDAIASATHQVLTDGDLRNEMIAKGIGQAATFSWRRHTLESLAVIRKVHEQLRML